MHNKFHSTFQHFPLWSFPWILSSSLSTLDVFRTFWMRKYVNVFANFCKHKYACFPVSILGSILNGKMVFEDGKCRTAEFNPIIALLMGQEPIIIKNGVSVCTETPLLYPEPGSNRHGSPHWCLRPARLPIPPSGPFICAPEGAASQRLRTFEGANVCTFI